MGLRRGLRVEHQLHDPRALAQVDEDQTAVVAPPVHPARDPRLAAGASRRRAVRPSCRGRSWRGARASCQPAPAQDRRDHRGRLELDLLAALHVLQADRHRVADDGNVACVDPVGVLELALERARAQLEPARSARPVAPPPRARARRRPASGAARATNRSTSSAGTGSSPADISIRSTPAAHPDGRRGRAAELLDQSVVAPAPSHSGLRAERVGGELEHGPRVVVQAAHQRGSSS